MLSESAPGDPAYSWRGSLVLYGFALNGEPRRHVLSQRSPRYRFNDYTVTLSDCGFLSVDASRESTRIPAGFDEWPLCGECVRMPQAARD